MMLYTAVEGHHPLRRGNTLATLAAVLNDDVPPPVRAGALGDVLMSVLVRDPAARPSSAVLDRRLAEIESGSAGLVTAWQQPTAPYPLNPPSAGAAPSYPGAFAPHTAPLAGPPAPAGGAGPGGLRAPPVLCAPPSVTSAPECTGSPAPARAVHQSKDTTTTSLLPPGGIRTAIKALQQETG